MTLRLTCWSAHEQACLNRGHSQANSSLTGVRPKATLVSFDLGWAGDWFGGHLSSLHGSNWGMRGNASQLGLLGVGVWGFCCCAIGQNMLAFKNALLQSGILLKSQCYFLDVFLSASSWMRVFLAWCHRQLCLAAQNPCHWWGKLVCVYIIALQLHNSLQNNSMATTALGLRLYCSNPSICSMKMNWQYTILLSHICNWMQMIVIIYHNLFAINIQQIVHCRLFCLIQYASKICAVVRA